MDYEKAYKEALERARAGKPMNEVFPELHESEDERIRKSFLKLVSNDKNNGYTEFYKAEGITCDDAIAYLEKLKEFQFGYPGVYFYDGEKLHFQGNPAMEEKQKEQKPSIKEPKYESFEDGNATGWRIKQQPTECLKPEKDCWYVCIKDFYGGGKKQSSKGDLVQAKGGIYMMGRDDISEWFRKAYYDEIKPAEWSEEDKKMLEAIVGDIHCGTNFNAEVMREANRREKWLRGRLKSLRPQPHWKPSEEQMSTLRAIINEPNNASSETCTLGLKALYDDLKKLM